MPHLIQTAILACTIPQFRVRLERLDNLLGAKSWVSSNQVRLVFGEFPYSKWSYENTKTNDFVPMGMYQKSDNIEHENISEKIRSSTRASWAVVPWNSTSMRPWYDTAGFYFAGLELYKIADKEVRIDFLDGYNPEHPKKDFHPIGVPFEEFSSFLFGELKDIIKSNFDQEKLISQGLLHLFNEHFNEEELKTFCFYLNVDYENLPAAGKENKARELILYFQRRGQLAKLCEQGKFSRPEIDWPEI